MITITMIRCLHTGYARITQRGLEEKEKPLKEEWDPNHPIEALC